MRGKEKKIELIDESDLALCETAGWVIEETPQLYKRRSKIKVISMLICAEN